MSKDEKRPGARKNAGAEYFKKTFNTKKKTVRELRGGTAKEDREHYLKQQQQDGESNTDQPRKYAERPPYNRDRNRDGGDAKPRPGQYEKRSFNKERTDQETPRKKWREDPSAAEHPLDGEEKKYKKPFPPKRDNPRDDAAGKPWLKKDRDDKFPERGPRKYGATGPKRYEGSSGDSFHNKRSPATRSNTTNRDKPYKKDSEYGSKDKPYTSFRKPLDEQDRKGPRSYDRGSEESPKRNTPFKKDFKKPDYNREDKGDRGYKENSRPYSDKDTYKKPTYARDGEQAFKPRFDKRFIEEIKEEMPLNKFIAHSGVCGRREAAELVKQGKVKVNGELVLEPGYKVQPKDDITMSGKKLRPIKDLAYVLLNKPKDFVTTTKDPEGRKTVMELVANAEVPRLFPVGRLDRNTTGVLLLTNDGDLAQRLSHPSNEIKKVYQATLDKPFTEKHLEQLLSGITLEDGVAKADAASLLEDKNEVGIEIHNGKNRIVRRMFESLGYDVVKLDRVVFAGLTKKNLSRGKWRFLSEKEIIFLKHFK